MTREITITPVLNGFICKVGCQRVVFQSASAMLFALGLYYDNPDKIEKNYIESAINKMSDCPMPITAEPTQQCCDEVTSTSQGTIPIAGLAALAGTMTNNRR